MSPSALAVGRKRRTERPQSDACSSTGQALIGIVILIWTLLPIYNMVEVALRPKDAVFSDDLFPAHPTLAGFWTVLSQDYWYVEHFWREMGNSLYIGAATAFLTLAIGTMASFVIGPMRIRRRLDGQHRGAAHLCDPDVVLGDPVLPGDAELRLGRQSAGGDLRRGHVCHAVCDLHLYGVCGQHSGHAG